MINKQAELHALINNENLDILCITETWLNNSSPDEIVVIPGFRMFRKDRHQTTLQWANLGGGGVAIFIKEHVTCVTCPNYSPENSEFITVKIKHGTGSLYLSTIYRSPRQPMHSLLEAIDQLSELIENETCIIVGDFNAKNTEWKSTDKTDNNGKLLQSAFLRHGLSVANKQQGTRPNLLNNTNPLLDIITTNAPHMLSLTESLSPFSDHCPVVTSIHLPTLPSTTRNGNRVRKRIDYSLLRQLLERYPLMERIMGTDNANFAWKAWYTHLHSLVLQSTIWSRLPPHKHKFWFTPHLHKLKKRQDRLYRQCLRKPHSIETKISYCLVRNLFRSQTRNAKKCHTEFNALKLSQDCRKGGYIWWKRAKQFCNIASKIQQMPDLELDSQTVTSSHSKASLLSNYFASQSQQSPKPFEMRHNTRTADSPLFSFQTFTPGQVHWDLTHLNTRKATSETSLMPILRNLADLLCESLSWIFNLSIASCTFPEQWKIAKVIPIFKNRGKSSDPGNYRPISLLHPVARIFESRLADSLKNYLTTNNILTPHQFAYMPQRSATDQLLLLTHHMATIKDKRGNYDCVFLDFRKAFDRVDHRALLGIIATLTDQRTVKWFENYLSNRTIQVCVESVLSSPSQITAGVPQGSHFAPLLFAMYINSLPQSISNSSPFLFADDVTLLFRHRPQRSLDENKALLETDIASCQLWAKRVHGNFSVQKTTLLSTAYTCEEQALVMDSVPLSPQKNTKHLGVTLTANLDFTHHLSAITSRFSKRIALLCYMGRSLQADAIILLYKSYVRPAVEYAIPVWCFRITQAQITALDILQAKICRRLLKSCHQNFEYDESKENLNKLCSLQSLKYRRQIISLVTLFKFIHFHPNYLEQFNIYITKSTRRPNKLVFNNHGRVLSSLFMHRIGTMWNCLPPSLTSLDNLSKFTCALRHFTLKYQFSCNGIPS